MSPQQEAVALWKFLENRGFKPTIRSVGRVLRDQGIRFNDHAIRDWLRAFSPRCHRNTPQKSNTITATHLKPTAASREKEVSLVSTSSSGSYEPSEPPTLFSSNGATNGKPKKPPPDKAWIPPLLAAVKAIAERRLETLDPAERLLAARGFAYHVGNCTADERNNRTKGAHVAQGLASIAYSDYGGWTVAMYLGSSMKAKHLRGDVPTLDPWIFKAALAAPERQAL